MTRVSNPSIGADSHWSRPFPCGTPSITSTRTTVRASCFSARRCAAVAPTLPAPTTVILFIMGGKATDSFPLATGGSGCEGGRSPAPGVHPPVGIGPQRIDPIQGPPVRHAEPFLRPAIAAALPRFPDERRQIFIGGPAAERLTQIDSPRGVQTEEPCPVSGDAAAITRAAERRRDRGDDAEGRPIREPEALGGGAAVGRHRVDRPLTAGPHPQHLPPGHHLVLRPPGRSTHVHVLDEPHFGVLAAGGLRQNRQL